jgi:endonuclease YncB( thermonuclease family)
LLSLTSAAQAQSITLRGKVIKVIDGDTFTLLDGDNAEHNIRIEGVDAPEEGQSYYDDAKKRLSDLLLNKEVSVEIVGKEDPNREIGILKLDGKDMGLEMLDSGLAWHNEYFDLNQSQDAKTTYTYAQLRARGAKRGVWADINPTSPWAFRRSQQPAPTTATTQTQSTDSSTSTPQTDSGGTVHVKGYYRKDGTHVKPHTRRAPRKP